MTIDVLLICKNNVFYFENIFPKIYLTLLEFNPTFYIYENNSTDKTAEILLNLEKKYDNIKVHSEYTKTYLNRYLNICNARNSLIEFYKKEESNNNSKFVLMLDTNILFKSNTIRKLFDLSKKKNDAVLLTPFTTYYNINDNNYKYYFDILAYNYGKYFYTKTSPSLTFEIMQKDNNTNDEFASVDTCFGGLGLIRKDLLTSLPWKFIKPKEVVNSNISKNIICEHWNYCKKLKEFGNIYIQNNSKAVWLIENDIRHNKEKIIKFINDEYYF